MRGIWQTVWKKRIFDKGKGVTKRSFLYIADDKNLTKTRMQGIIIKRKTKENDYGESKKRKETKQNEKVFRRI